MEWSLPECGRQYIRLILNVNFLARGCVDVSDDEPAQLVKRISIQPAIGFSSSAFEFVGCSLHHGLRSFIAMDEVLVFFRHERYASKQICNETFNGNVE
jgi:hypothetical protein